MPGILYEYEYVHSALRRLFNLGHAWRGENVPMGRINLINVNALESV